MSGELDPASPPRPRARPIAEKVKAGERLTAADGLALYAPPICSASARWPTTPTAPERRPGVLLRQPAHQPHQRLHPAEHLRLLLVRPDAEGGRRLHPLARSGVSRGGAGPGHADARVPHRRAGCIPSWAQLLHRHDPRASSERYPHVHIKALTAVEIAHIARIEKVSEREVLIAMTRGGAHQPARRRRRGVQHRRARDHRRAEADRRGMASGAPRRARARHSDQLHHALRSRRDGRGPDRASRACCATLQDETGGFLTYIPLAYHPDHNELGEEMGRVGTATTGYEDLKNIAVGRLFLDNIPHIKTHWPMVTPFLSQIALSFGCDDVEGTVVYERIYHEAGAHTAHAHALPRPGPPDPRSREAAGRAG